ncbi:MAG: pentapeptide repeat-containing protein [Pseudomonadota bacterium]
MASLKKKTRRVKRTPRAPERAQGGNTDVLDHIAKVSQNARAIWFGLLALLAFVTVTLMTHEDADFYAVDAATKLPVVNIDVPPMAFFIAAPVLTATLYCYLHLYLINLWDALADAPPRAGGEPLSERIFPTLLGHAALWYRNRMRGDGSAPERAMGAAMALASIILAWGYGVVVLGLLFLASLARHNELLGFWTALCLGTAIVVGVVTFNVMRRRMADRDRDVAHQPWGREQRGDVVRLALFLGRFSWLSTGGFEQPIRWIGPKIYEPPRPFQTQPYDDPISRSLDYEYGLHSLSLSNAEPPWYEVIAEKLLHSLAPVDLHKAQLSSRPEDWETHNRWFKRFEAEYFLARKWDRDRPLSNDEQASLDAEKWDEYRRYISFVSAPSIERADLRLADLRYAFLAGADLEGVLLQNADLRWAQLQGVNLSKSKMQNADLRDSLMEAATLKDAAMQGAVLAGAQMLGVDFRNTALQRADLTGANLTGTNIGKASLDEAHLNGAQLFYADLRHAELNEVDLFHAGMDGADLYNVKIYQTSLSGATLQGSNLASANVISGDMINVKLQAAYLLRARFLRVNCHGAEFLGAIIDAAEIACLDGVPNQAQLSFAVGDERTRLPSGRYVRNCLDLSVSEVKEKKEEIDSVIQLHPESIHPLDEAYEARITEQDFRDRLFCKPGQRSIRLYDDPWEARFYNLDGSLK